MNVSSKRSARNSSRRPDGSPCRPQTAHVLALMFNLVDGTVRQRTAGRLAELIEEQDCHLTTGFVGTPYLNLVLSENGYHDLACKLLLKTDYPSWLYQITKGATTVWEHWDGIKEDGSFWSKDMNSFNHYAYGSIGEWLYRVLAGIDTDDAKTGYKHIHIRPRPGAELTRVEASLKSMYGEIVSSWKREGQQMEIRVNIPPNTTATIVLPGAERSRVKEGQTSLDQCEGIESCAETNEGLVLEAGSGHYCFTYPV